MMIVTFERARCWQESHVELPACTVSDRGGWLFPATHAVRDTLNSRWPGARPPAHEPGRASGPGQPAVPPGDRRGIRFGLDGPNGVPCKAVFRSVLGFVA